METPALACIGILHGESKEQRDAALATLARLMSEAAEEAAVEQMRDLVRSTDGCLEHVCASLHAGSAATQSALVILGNVVSEGTNIDRHRVRELGALDRVLELLRSTEPELLRCAAGACMNFCHSFDEASRITEVAMERLIELGASDDPAVAEFSTGALHNIQVCMARESLTRISVERYENAAATAIQAVVCGFIARQRRRAQAKGLRRPTAAGGVAQDHAQEAETGGDRTGALISGSSGVASSEHATPLPKALRISLRKSLTDEEERSQKSPRTMRALQRATLAATQGWVRRTPHCPPAATPSNQPLPSSPPSAQMSSTIFNAGAQAPASTATPMMSTHDAPAHDAPPPYDAPTHDPPSYMPPEGPSSGSPHSPPTQRPPSGSPSGSPTQGAPPHGSIPDGATDVTPAKLLVGSPSGSDRSGTCQPSRQEEELALLHSAKAAAARARAAEQAALQASEDAALRVWVRGRLRHALNAWSDFSEWRLLMLSTDAQCEVATNGYGRWQVGKAWERWAVLAAVAAAGRWFRQRGSKQALDRWKDHARTCREQTQLIARGVRHLRSGRRAELRAWTVWADAARVQPLRRRAEAHRRRHELTKLHERSGESSAHVALITAAREHWARRLVAHERRALGTWRQGCVDAHTWQRKCAHALQVTDARRLAATWDAWSLFVAAKHEARRRIAIRQAEERAQESERQEALLRATERTAAEAKEVAAKEEAVKQVVATKEAAAAMAEEAAATAEEAVAAAKESAAVKEDATAAKQEAGAATTEAAVAEDLDIGMHKVEDAVVEEVQKRPNEILVHQDIDKRDARRQTVDAFAVAEALPVPPIASPAKHAAAEDAAAVKVDSIADKRAAGAAAAANAAQIAEEPTQASLQTNAAVKARAEPGDETQEAAPKAAVLEAERMEVAVRRSEPEAEVVAAVDEGEAACIKPEPKEPARTSTAEATRSHANVAKAAAQKMEAADVEVEAATDTSELLTPTSVSARAASNAVVDQDAAQGGLLVEADASEESEKARMAATPAASWANTELAGTSGTGSGDSDGLSQVSSSSGLHAGSEAVVDAHAEVEAAATGVAPPSLFADAWADKDMMGESLQTSSISGSDGGELRGCCEAAFAAEATCTVRLTSAMGMAGGGGRPLSSRAVARSPPPSPPCISCSGALLLSSQPAIIDDKTVPTRPVTPRTPRRGAGGTALAYLILGLMEDQNKREKTQAENASLRAALAEALRARELYGQGATAPGSRVGGVGHTHVPSGTHYARITRPAQPLHATPGRIPSILPQVSPSRGVTPRSSRYRGQDSARSYRPQCGSRSGSYTEYIEWRTSPTSARSSMQKTEAKNQRPALWEHAMPKGWTLEQQVVHGTSQVVWMARSERSSRPMTTSPSDDEALHVGQRPPRQPGLRTQSALPNRVSPRTRYALPGLRPQSALPNRVSPRARYALRE